jgi:hypothetical protein
MSDEKMMDGMMALLMIVGVRIAIYVRIPE